MELENKKYGIYCPVCGKLLEKTSRADSEICCHRCKTELSVAVEKSSIKVDIKN